MSIESYVSILFGVGYLVLEYQKAGTGVSHVWYWSIIMLVLEYHFAGTAHEAALGNANKNKFSFVISLVWIKISRSKMKTIFSFYSLNRFFALSLNKIGCTRKCK